MSGMVVVPPVAITPLAFPTMILILGQLGYEVVRGIREIRSSGKVQAKSQVFRSANGVEVEVTVTDNGEIQLCCDANELRAKEGVEEQDLMQKIVQMYTHETVIKELQAKGYTIVENEELDTGTVRLVVRKWS